MMTKFVDFMSGKGGQVVGLIFTLVVVAMIIYGNFIGTSSTHQAFVWETRPTLHICDTAPSWARPGDEGFDKALKFWEDRGWAFDNIEIGPCSETCEVVDEKTGEVGQKTCNKGKVTIDIMDQWFEPEHAGACTYRKSMAAKGVATDDDWTTITLPEVIYGSDEIADPFGGKEVPELPLGVNGLVAAHEIGHCLAGLEHNIGPVLIPYVAHLNPKTGHIQNPSVFMLGWGDEALPAPPSDWD